MTPDETIAPVDGPDDIGRSGASELPSVDPPPAAADVALPLAAPDGPAPVAAAPAVEPTSPEPPTEEPVIPESPTPDGPTPTDPEIVESVAVATAFKQIERLLGENVRLLDRQTATNAALHAENQRLRKGELRAAQQGLVVSILRVCDDLDQTLAAMTDEEPGRRDLTIVRAILFDVLAHNGVETMSIEPGEPFDGRRHRVVQVRPTADDSAHRTVAEVVKPGHAWADGPIIRAADVAVLKYAPRDESPTDEQPAPAPA